MTSMVAIDDEVDACLSIKTFLQRRARNIALEECSRRAITAPKPFKNLELIEAIDRCCGVVASAKIVA